MAYGNALQSLLGGGGGSPLGAPPSPASLGTGAPPSMPGLPPAPTGLGAMPTGDPSTTKKASADQAIMALRECKGHYPELGTMLDATVDALKQVTAAQSPAIGLGTPTPPGAPTPAPTPVMESGSDGTA